MYIASCDMTLGEKIRYLRDVEGSLRGLGRPMSQQELVAGIKQEVRETISQSYLSQIENGQRPHLTNKTRSILARFFKVHPGFLVDDPPGYHMDLQSDLRTTEGQLDLWLLQGADRFHSDKDLAESLHRVASQKDSRRCLVLLGEILDTPGLQEQLWQVLKGANGRRKGTAR
jgi:transcriptional regulator with XRE-family HTH domain